MPQAVQTGHQNYRRGSLEVDLAMLAAHKLAQGVVDNLDHHLLGLHCAQHVGAHSFGLYSFAELLGHFVRHIGVQQGATDFLESFCNVNFGDFAFTFQYLE